MYTRIVHGRVYDGSRAIGRAAPSGPGFSWPISVALGGNDVVYVISRGQEGIGVVAKWNRNSLGCRVTKFTVGPVPGDEEFVGEFTGYGDEPGRVIWPADIAVDSEDNIYITDEWLNRITTFDKDGAFLTIWGSQGVGDGEFNRPSGIAIDDEDNVLVVDSLNHRVQKLNREGKFLGKWGSFGSGDGDLSSPWGIDIDNEGYVYVVDHGNHRAQKFTPEGEFAAKFGSYGNGRGELNRPVDVAVDPDGDVYVCDWTNNRVQAFGPDGSFLITFVGDAHELSKWGQMSVDANEDVFKARRRASTMEPEWRFLAPRGIAFDGEKGHLVIADSTRHRVQIYSKLKDYVDPQFNL